MCLPECIIYSVNAKTAGALWNYHTQSHVGPRSKLAIFAIFNERLSTQNVNVARNVECDFLTYFETLCETRFLIYWKIGQVIIPMARRGSEVLKSMKPIYQDVASLMMAER